MRTAWTATSSVSVRFAIAVAAAPLWTTGSVGWKLTVAALRWGLLQNLRIGNAYSAITATEGAFGRIRKTRSAISHQSFLSFAPVG